MTSYINYL